MRGHRSRRPPEQMLEQGIAEARKPRDDRRFLAKDHPHICKARAVKLADGRRLVMD